MDPALIDKFHEWWYLDKRLPWKTTWRNVSMVKNPLDLWVVAELIWKIQPDWIIETGTHLGGSAMFYGDLCQLVGRGHVITIDIEECAADHPNVTFLTGNSTEIDLPRVDGTVMVILDSDHSEQHVGEELERFAPLVSTDSYMIVEDTNVAGHPVEDGTTADPWAAVEAFLEEHPEFERDPVCEKYVLTMNPGGWLRRVR